MPCRCATFPLDLPELIEDRAVEVLIFVPLVKQHVVDLAEKGAGVVYHFNRLKILRIV